MMTASRTGKVDAVKLLLDRQQTNAEKVRRRSRSHVGRSGKSSGYCEAARRSRRPYQCPIERGLPDGTTGTPELRHRRILARPDRGVSIRAVPSPSEHDGIAVPHETAT
jgi:hypothetical protein